MSEHEKDTAFLRQYLLCNDSAERQKLDESITQLQCNARCVRRAMGLMALLFALATAGVWLLETRQKSSIVPLAVAAEDRDNISGQSEGTVRTSEIAALPKALTSH